MWKPKGANKRDKKLYLRNAVIDALEARAIREDRSPSEIADGILYRVLINGEKIIRSATEEPQNVTVHPQAEPTRTQQPAPETVAQVTKNTQVSADKMQCNNQTRDSNKKLYMSLTYWCIDACKTAWNGCGRDETAYKTVVNNYKENIADMCPEEYLTTFGINEVLRVFDRYVDSETTKKTA